MWFDTFPFPVDKQHRNCQYNLLIYMEIVGEYYKQRGKKTIFLTGLDWTVSGAVVLVLVC